MDFGDKIHQHSDFSEAGYNPNLASFSAAGETSDFITQSRKSHINLESATRLVALVLAHGFVSRYDVTFSNPFNYRIILYVPERSDL